MTERVLPPPGWYSDPELAGHLRWWDGTQWSASMATPPPATLGPGFRMRMTVLTWLIGAQGALYVAMCGVYVWGLEGLPRDTAYADTFGTYAVLDIGLSLALFPLMIMTIVVWCMWQHRLALVAGRDRTRRSPGMHVGSWFIPVVALWFPLQNLRDLWAAYVGGEGRALLGWWWTGWLVANLSSRVLTRTVLADDASATEVNLVSLVDALFWIPTCVLAVLVVRRLSEAALQREGAATGQYAGRP